MTEPSASNRTSAARSLWQDVGYRLRRNKPALVSAVVLVVVALLALVGPLLSRHDYAATNLAYGAQAPSAEHWFGTDDLGRDLFVRTLHGGRLSIGVGLAATAVSLVIGVLYGSISGYAGGRTDAVMMRAVETLYALPFTIIVVLLTVAFGQSLLLLFLAIGAVEWLVMARIVRGQVLGLRHQQFIDAARALGSPPGRILLRHVLPNIAGPVIVYTTLTIPAVILLESILSFLGLGVQPPQSSWGLLIKEGAAKIDVYPWMLIFPALFFSITLFTLNFIGDGLRDALDPKQQDG